MTLSIEGRATSQVLAEIGALLDSIDSAARRMSSDGERLETEHQPGTGSWDPLVGFAASKRWGPVSLDGNALYQFSTKGAQDTELGDRLSLGPITLGCTQML